MSPGLHRYYDNWMDPMVELVPHFLWESMGLSLRLGDHQIDLMKGNGPHFLRDLVPASFGSLWAPHVSSGRRNDPIVG